MIFVHITLPSFKLTLIQSNENQCYLSFFEEKRSKIIAGKHFKAKYQNAEYDEIILPIVIERWGMQKGVGIGW